MMSPTPRAMLISGASAYLTLRSGRIWARMVSRIKMLGEIPLYWLTHTAASAARFQVEQSELLRTRNNPRRVELAEGVSEFPHDLVPARSWAESEYPKLFYWHEFDRRESLRSARSCALFTGELRRCLRPLRNVRLRDPRAQRSGRICRRAVAPMSFPRGRHLTHTTELPPRSRVRMLYRKLKELRCPPPLPPSCIIAPP